MRKSRPSALCALNELFVNERKNRVVGQFEIVILSKPLLRSEEPALSEVEGIWASRAKRRFLGGAIIARLARSLINFKLTHYQKPKCVLRLPGIA
jgi:hypothetical protein